MSDLPRRIVRSIAGGAARDVRADRRNEPDRRGADLLRDPFSVVPLLEDAFRPTVPTESSLSRHVIVCADAPREAGLQADLRDACAPRCFLLRTTSKFQ